MPKSICTIRCKSAGVNNVLVRWTNFLSVVVNFLMITVVNFSVDKNKFMGKMMFTLAFSVALWALSELFKIQFLFTVGMVLFICIIVFMIIYLNTNNRFKKNSDLGNNKVQGKTVGIVVAVILVIPFIFVFFLMQGSFAKPSYSFSNNNLTISGQFGVKINLLGATVTHERSQVPTTETKTNGAAIGKIEKGYFIITGSKVYLNVMDENASSYILITDKNGSKYYINCASSEETTNLYNEILAQNGSVESIY